ncbi:unnamed protein product, partial [Iphiclides podalirius]
MRRDPTRVPAGAPVQVQFHPTRIPRPRHQRRRTPREQLVEFRHVTGGIAYGERISGVRRKFLELHRHIRRTVT